MLKRSYPNINTAALDDDEWVQLYAEWVFCEKQKYELAVTAQKEALTEILNEIAEQSK